MKTLLLVALLLVGAVQAQEVKWKTYVNARFGFSVAYPSVLIPSRAPENGAGREFHTENEEFSLLAHAHFLGSEAETIDSVWSETLKELGATVSYKRKGNDWFVVSGVTNDGTEYYHKWHMKERNWAEIRITYPHTKNKKYDPWVERIAKSFVPFLKGNFDRSQ